MSKRLSLAIVDFIGGLYPLYMQDGDGPTTCARCLQDGTLILPVEEDDDNENGDVEIHWQGDPTRKTITRGAYIASIAVARYSELRAIAESSKHLAYPEMTHLAHHFTVKTGETLVFDMPDEDAELFGLIGKGISRLGKEALIAILRAKLGGML